MDELIWGILALLIFASPFIALIIIVIIKVHSAIKKRKQPQNVDQSVSIAEAAKSRQTKDIHKPVIKRKQNPFLTRAKAIALFLVSILLIIFGGTVAGITAAVVSSVFYIALIFPLVLGFVGGFILTAAIQGATIRKTFLFLFMACLMAISIYGMYHYGRYVALQVRASLEIHSNINEAMNEKNLKVARALVDYSLEEETGYSGLLGYMLFQAKEGVSLGRFYSSNRINLGPLLSWVYWALEFGIILWLTMMIGRKELLIPVCEACGSPYGREKHLGGVVEQKETMLLSLIKQKTFAEVGSVLEENASVPSIELYLQSCERCGEGKSYLFVRRTSRNTDGKLVFTDALQTMLPPSDSRLLMDQSKLINT